MAQQNDSETLGVSSKKTEVKASGKSSVKRQQREPGGRNKRWCVRATASAAAVIERKAEEAGVSVPRLLVSLGADSPVRSAVERKAAVAVLRAVNRNLVGVATNLNQLSHWSNSRVEPPDSSELAQLQGQVAEAVEAVRVALDEVSRT